MEAGREGEARAAGRAGLRRMSADRYRDFTPAGVGGMGIVYRAIDADLNRVVAFKIVRPDGAGGTPPAVPLSVSPPAEGAPGAGAYEALKARFLQEAWVTAGLDHPGIVPVYELGETPEGVPYYTMRFVRGERTFADALREAESAPIDARLRLLEPFLRVCETVSYAHARGVIHRDLKPENMALGEFGEVVLLDWGLARFNDRPDAADPGEFRDRLRKFRESVDANSTVGVLGTPGYLAPEALLGSAADERSDVYGLGVILYQILAGRRPHAFESYAEFLEKLRRVDPPPPRDVDPAAPAALSDLAMAALARDPAARIGGAAELARRVRSWQASSAREREAEEQRIRAEEALAAAEGTEGIGRGRHVDRAVAALDRVEQLGATDSRVRRLRERLESLRAAAMAERERSARRSGFRRAGIAALVFVALGALAASALLEASRREIRDERDRAEAAEKDAERQRRAAAEQAAAARRNLALAYAELSGALLRDGRHAAARVAGAQSLAVEESDRGWRALLEAEGRIAFASAWLPGTIDPSSWIVGSAALPSGFLVAEADGQAWLWPGPFDGPPSPVAEPAPEPAAPRAVSAGGGRVYMGGQDGTVRILDPTGVASPEVRRFASGAITALAASPDGRWLAVGTMGDGRFRICDVATTRIVAELPSVGDWALDAAFAADGRLVFAVGDKSALAFDLETREVSWSRDAPARRVVPVAGGGAVTVSLDRLTLSLVDPTGAVLRTIGPTAREIGSLCATPDGRYVALRDEEHRLLLYDLADGRLASAPYMPGPEFDLGTEVAISADGRWLFASCLGRDPRDPRWYERPLGVRAYDLRSVGACRVLHAESTSQAPATHGGLATTPDGRCVAWGGHDGTRNLLRLFDRRSGGVRAVSTNEQTFGIVLSPDGETAWFGAHDGDVVRFRTSDGLVERRARVLPPEHVQILGADREATRLFVTSPSDGAVHLVDAETLRLAGRIGGDGVGVSDCLPWPGTDRLLVTTGAFEPSPSGGGSYIDLGLAFATLDGRLQDLGLPAVGPIAVRGGAGIRGAAATIDGTVLLLDAEGRLVRRAESARGAFRSEHPNGHAQATALALSPDGRWVLGAEHRMRSGAQDFRLLVWRTEDGTLVRDVPSPHGGWIDEILFAPEEEVFYTIADDAAREWRLDLLIAEPEARLAEAQERYGITVEGFAPRFLPVRED